MNDPLEVTAPDLTSNADLGDLLDAVDKIIATYVVMNAHQRVAVALWVLHAHAIDAFDVTPYLNVRSAEKRSGKTRLLEVLAELVPTPWHTVQPTEAVLFRKIDRAMPTLLLDEVDAIFKGPASDRTEGLRAVLNAGYRKGVTVERCTGPKMDRLAEFKTFCPKVLAGIGTLPDTVADRAIPIVLRRRTKTEAAARFRKRDVERAVAPLKQAIVLWAAGAVDALRERAASVVVTEALGDRAAEVWEPLAAIADAAGDSWATRAREAAVALHGATPDAPSLGVLLLRALKAIFATRPTAERMLTTELLTALVDRDGEPWAGWWGEDVLDGKMLGPAGRLASLLRPYGIISNTWRVDGDRGKGYARSDFADAFARYVDSEAVPA